MRRASQPPSPCVKERKVSQSASCKIDCIIRQLFLPMLGMPTPDKTSFLAEEDTLIRQVAEECPAALASEADFVEYMVVLYRKFQKDEGPASLEDLVEGLAPVAGKAGVGRKVAVKLLQDPADLPEAFAHAVDPPLCVGQPHDLGAGLEHVHTLLC